LCLEKLLHNHLAFDILNKYHYETNGTGPFKDVYSVMANWGANHGAISYGHIVSGMITLASMLRIPVSMHNVVDENIFRPSAWSAFGSDKEGADYRACNTYDPLH